MPADQALRRSLVATLSYFDLFDYPLTLAELMRHRYRFPDERPGADWSAADVLAALDDAAFGTKDGHWFLAGREGTVGTRARRFRLAERKLARARRVASFLRFLPSVRLIAVCNSLAIANADVESDIDLFVVARPGTLWATRFAVVSALALLGLRPNDRSHADKVCMSFFVSEECTDLSRCALAPEDTYLRYWIATLLPLYDAGGTYDRFVGANAWVADRLPGFRATDVAAAVPPAPRWARVFAPLVAALERPARRFQMRAFPGEIARLANLDSRVMVSDDILKFHVNDRRDEYERRFRQRIEAVVPALERAVT